MRILCVHSELGVLAGGGESFTRHLLEALVARGHALSAVYVARPDATVPLPLPTRVCVEPLAGHWNRNLGQPALSAIGDRVKRVQALEPLWARIQLAVAWRVVRWHNARFRGRVLRHLKGRWASFDVAYVYGQPQLAADIAARLPAMLMLLGPVGLECKAWLDATQVVCANGDVLCQLRRLFGDRVQDLPLGLDAAHFHPEGQDHRQELGWGGDEVVIGYTGRMTVLKGVGLLVDAFCEVALDYPQLRLLLVGDGEEMPAIQSRLRRAGLQHRCHLAGRQAYESLPTWYRTMDMFVLPSRYENYSLAMMEAMGCGLPALASRVGGNITMVAESGSGWLFEPGSSQSLAQRLRQALAERPTWPARGRCVRLFAEGRSWDHTAEIFETLVGSQVHGKGSHALA